VEEAADALVREAFGLARDERAMVDLGDAVE
jgi:hypothetical protein